MQQKLRIEISAAKISETFDKELAILRGFRQPFRWIALFSDKPSDKATEDYAAIAVDLQ